MIPINVFCKDTQIYFNNIYEYIKKSKLDLDINKNKKINFFFQKLNDVSIDLDKIKITNEENKKIKLGSNIFISKNIRKKILELKNITKITYDNLIINIYSDSEIEKRIIIRILIIYEWLYSLPKKKKEKKCKIHLYLTNEKKFIKNDKILGRDNVNSGSTSNRYFIQIWRKEEMFKVLIHEIIHQLCYDIKYDYKIINEINEIIKNKLNIDKNSMVLINEAYVDTLTIILHTIYITHFLKKRNLFEKLLLCEIYFSLYQCSKIIRHYKLKNFEELFIENQKKNKIKQKTSVFSYYIIKSILLFNLDRFLDFIKDFDGCKYPENNTNKDFLYFIFDCYQKNTNYVKTINSINIIKDDTLRMSILQLK